MHFPLKLHNATRVLLSRCDVRCHGAAYPPNTLLSGALEDNVEGLDNAAEIGIGDAGLLVVLAEGDACLVETIEVEKTTRRVGVNPLHQIEAFTPDQVVPELGWVLFPGVVLALPHFILSSWGMPSGMLCKRTLPTPSRQQAQQVSFFPTVPCDNSCIFQGVCESLISYQFPSIPRSKVHGRSSG